VSAVVHAYAKLTLSLRVLGRRADGYHDLDALAVLVREPYDTVRVDRSGEPRLTVTGPYAQGVPTDGTNLAVQALRLVGRDAAITLHKGIPHGGGLGGGSSDAAAVLRTFAATRAQAHELAARLGSDVPFCVGGRPARMRGRGEVLEPVSVPVLHVVIATPRLRCATPAVYRAWDELGGPRSGRTVLAPGIDEVLVNDLEPAAEHVEPRLREFRARFQDAVGTSALLCGSGSSFAAWFDSQATAREAAESARRHLDAAGVWATSTWAG